LLGESGGEDDGEVVFFGEVCECGEDGAGGVWAVGVLESSVGESEVMGDGVDDEECEAGDGLDGAFEECEGVLFLGDGFFVGDEGVEVGEGVDVVEVGVEEVEFWAEEVFVGVVGGEEEGGLGMSFKFRVSSFKIGERRTIGEGCGEVEEEGGFSLCGV
jgi:hypothetical protein